MPPMSIRSISRIAVPIGATLAFAACGDDDAAATDAAPDDAAPPTDAGPANDAGPIGAGCTPTDSTDLALELVAQGLQRPLYVTAPEGDPRLFILEQPGRIRIVEDGQLLSDPFLDITGTATDGANEQGLLGLAFHPDYAQNGRFFVNYTAADLGGDTVVAEYEVSGDPNVADAGSERRVIEIAQDFGNHNGGMIEFGPDGYLYIGMGDGGSAGDPEDRAQDLQSHLGAMLRIDVDDGDPYGIPADNPFVGDEDALDEIWAYGLRNPWRWSFDRADDMLYIADVGQGEWEEVNAEPASAAGLNYGWPCKEGLEDFRPGECDPGDELTDPVHVYPIDQQPECAVTGGYVYRGECLLALQGDYLFGDFCSNRVWRFTLEGGEATDLEELTGNLDPGGEISALSSFGEDAFGELYVTSLSSGQVHRIVTADAE